MAEPSRDQFKDAFQALVQGWNLDELEAQAEKFRESPLVFQMINDEIWKKSGKEVLGCELFLIKLTSDINLIFH